MVRLIYNWVNSERITFCCIFTIDQLIKSLWVMARLMTFQNPPCYFLISSVHSVFMLSEVQTSATKIREMLRSLFDHENGRLELSTNQQIVIYRLVIWWLAKTFEIQVKWSQFTSFWHWNPHFLMKGPLINSYMHESINWSLPNGFLMELLEGRYQEARSLSLMSAIYHVYDMMTFLLIFSKLIMTELRYQTQQTEFFSPLLFKARMTWIQQV